MRTTSTVRHPPGAQRRSGTPPRRAERCRSGGLAAGQVTTVVVGGQAICLTAQPPGTAPSTTVARQGTTRSFDEADDPKPVLALEQVGWFHRHPGMEDSTAAIRERAGGSLARTFPSAPSTQAVPEVARSGGLTVVERNPGACRSMSD